MMRSLWSAASGMVAQQANMDVVAHNLANVNTYGNKKVRAEFQDLVYQTLRGEGGASGEGGVSYPQGMQIGLGARLTATNRIFTQGPLQTTDRPTDIGIQGEGFFQVQLPDGTTGYTRDGSFKLDSTNRQLVTTNGYQLIPNITLPDDGMVENLVISSDGTVSINEGNVQTEIGNIQIVRFVNPEGLHSNGGNIFTETTASGAPIVGTPGQDGAGTLQQKTIEMSSVQVVEEMVNMIVAQRAYESNSKAITTSDSMLETANGLKR